MPVALSASEFALIKMVDRTRKTNPDIGATVRAVIARTGAKSIADIYVYHRGHFDMILDTIDEFGILDEEDDELQESLVPPDKWEDDEEETFVINAQEEYMRYTRYTRDEIRVKYIPEEETE